MNTVIHEIREVADVYTGEHFVYTGGAHGDGYINYRALVDMRYQTTLRAACRELLDTIIEVSGLDKRKPITVLGPETMGALMVAQMQIISCIGGELDINIGKFTKQGDTKKFQWDADATSIVVPGGQIVWVDDLLNAGTTFRTTNKMVAKLGGRIHTIGVFGDRSTLSPKDLGVEHIVALEQFNLALYNLSDGPCELCRENIPIVRRPGHGWRYESQHPNYSGGYKDL